MCSVVVLLSPFVLTAFRPSHTCPHLQVHADLHLFATLLPASSTVFHTFQPSLTAKPKAVRNAYIHVVQTSGFNIKESLASGARISVNGGELELGEGDGAFVTGGKPGQEFDLTNVGKGEAEVLVFDLSP